MHVRARWRARVRASEREGVLKRTANLWPRGARFLSRSSCDPPSWRSASLRSFARGNPFPKFRPREIVVVAGIGRHVRDTCASSRLRFANRAVALNSSRPMIISPSRKRPTPIHVGVNLFVRYNVRRSGISRGNSRRRVPISLGRIVADRSALTSLFSPKKRLPLMSLTNIYLRPPRPSPWSIGNQLREPRR